MPTIDQKLYRNLKDGNQYNGLIPPYIKLEESFDPEANNINTYDTLKFMSQWATKYAYQMQKVAPLLKGYTITETVNNIYNFLYWHFQYKLDGQTQNLYAPSAAWHFRQIGFDCKTYSLLASAILLNLKIIPHSFRMVQQEGIMPGQWSHVYVVVQDANKELVIDATKTPNIEVSFTKKYDLVMHRGLAMPYLGNQLGCSCNGKLAISPVNSNVNAAINNNVFSTPAATTSLWGTVTNTVKNSIPSPSSLINNASVNGYNVVKTFDTIKSGDANAIGGLVGDVVKDWSVSGVNFLTVARIAAGDPTAMLEVGKEFFPKIFDAFSSLAKIKCINGTAYDAIELDKTKGTINVFVQKQINKINSFAREGAADDLAEAIAEFFAVTWTANLIYTARKAEGFNVCTRDNLDAAALYARNLNATLGAALTAWADKYYPLDNNFIDLGKAGKVPIPNIIKTNTITTKGNSFANKYRLHWSDTPQIIEGVSPILKRKISETENTLMAFEPTEYLKEMTSKMEDFDAKTYLRDLIKPLAVKGGGQVANQPNANNQNIPPNQENGGMSNVLVLGAAAIAIKLAFF